MIKELVSNISAWLARMPIDPAVKSVKYGFSSLVPATEQPAVYFNIAGVPRCNYLNERGNSLIKINVDIMLITSVLASEEYATIEAQKLLWQYDKDGKDAGFLPFLLSYQGGLLFYDRTGRAFMISNVSECQIFARDYGNNSRGAIKATVEISTIS